MRIVFMGTPEFAVPSLKILVESGFNIVGVVTATDKLGGRGGKQLLESDIKKYAVSEGLRVLQPKNLKAPEFIAELATLRADLQIVVAFRMLPVAVWDMPKHGTYNLHGSLLPKYRGAAPINWAIIKGEKETGVTSFKLKHAIDTGDILFQEKITIGNEDTLGDIYHELKELGAKVVLKTVKAVANNEVKLKPQDASLTTKAPKIHHDTCEIIFYQNAEDIRNLVRGLNPFPCAWFTLRDKNIKVYKTSNEICHHNIPPGRIQSDNKNYLKIACMDGWVHLEEIKMQGKKKMDVKSFLNGFDINTVLD